MSTVMQNPNQKLPTNPNINPVASPNPYRKPVPLTNPRSVTYEEVSKLFSLPLADAADSLGVCASVLKKICHENGLVRWPYRKFLFGKSIEQIKEDAAKEKAKQLNEVPKDTGKVRDDSSISTVASLPGYQLHNKTTSSTQSHTVMQLQGNKSLQVGGPQMLHGSNSAKGSAAETDEFIYGFPSDGLSTVSYRWWGNSCSGGSTNRAVKVSEDIPVDSKSIASNTDGKDLKNEGHDSSSVSPETGSLSYLRKRAAEEGREALKRGVLHCRYGTNKLDPNKKLVLQQIFKSSLATQVSSDESF